MLAELDGYSQIGFGCLLGLAAIVLSVHEIRRSRRPNHPVNHIPPKRTWKETRWVLMGCAIVMIFVGIIGHLPDWVSLGYVAIAIVLFIQIFIWIRARIKPPQ